ncbi:MAG: hypothetical protein K2F69_04115 [Bacteroidaceae bacterium]|nr:hypothetical protein [Bacteroidaceae bacterium]
MKAHYPLLMIFQFQENHKPRSTLLQSNKKKRKTEICTPQAGGKGQKFATYRKQVSNFCMTKLRQKTQLLMYSHGRSGIFRNSKWGSLQQEVGLNATEEGVLLKTKWDILQLDTRK